MTCSLAFCRLLQRVISFKIAFIALCYGYEVKLPRGSVRHFVDDRRVGGDGLFGSGVGEGGGGGDNAGLKGQRDAAIVAVLAVEARACKVIPELEACAKLVPK